MAKQDIGLIGLAVMGQSLVLNMKSKGYSVSAYNRTAERNREFAYGIACDGICPGSGTAEGLLWYPWIF